MKKICLLIIMILNVAPIFTFGATSVQNSAGETLRKMGILQGYYDGTLQLDNKITRAEFAVIISRLLGYDERPEAISTITDFPDVPSTHWAYSSVLIASDKGYIKGYPYGTFEPKNNINYAEAFTIMCRILGYKDADLEGTWPDNYINKATELGMTNNVTISGAKMPITRGETAVIIVNSLGLNIKN